MSSPNTNTNKNTYLTRSKKYASELGNNIQADPWRYVLYIFLAAVTIYMLYLIGYYIYYTVSGNPMPVYGDGTQVISTPVDAFTGDIVGKRFKVPTPTEGLTFTYSFWVYVEDWSYQFGNLKNIFVKGDANSDSGERAPGFWFYPRTNALHARISTTVDKNEGCDIQNIPLQKWNHIVYVLNNRTVDIYVNGKLERSCVLKGIPIVNSKSLIVAADGKGFYGKLANLIYYTKAIEPSDVQQIYKAGPYA